MVEIHHGAPELHERQLIEAGPRAEELHSLEGLAQPLAGGVDAVHRTEEHVAEERAAPQRDRREGARRHRGVAQRGPRSRRLVLGRRVDADHVVVDRDVPRLIAVDQLHRLCAQRVGHEVVDGPQQRDVEDQLA